MSRLLSLLLLLKASTIADAGIAQALSNCTNFTFPDEDVVRELCYSIMVLGPSPNIVTLPNGTEITEYLGGYEKTWSFEGDLGDGAFPVPISGLTTSVAWEGEDAEDCVATANGEECHHCTLCDDGNSFDADCTNLEYGRVVKCGEIVPLDGFSETEVNLPFFPYVSAYESVSVGGGGENAATPAVGGTPSESASPAALLRGGLMAIAGAVVMLAL
jgi:hypothetical protein